MNDQSPPKRVTRARAAAKTDTGIKTTKIATAASKAKVARTASTTKRKTRVDDDVQEEQQQQPQPEEIIEPEAKATRGRAKRTVQPEPEPAPEMNEAPIRPTRGRPKKATVAVETPAPEPARATRGRAKKVEVPEEMPIVAEGVPKRPTRARAATTTASKATAPKKSVKFEEPDKENIVPLNIDAKGKAKAEPATGLRAKPVRKPAATATGRTTRGRPKNTPEEKSSPLSPKKATQVATAKESVSEDELATTVKTPMKPLMKSPVKPPGSVLMSAKKLDFSTSSSITVSRATTQDLKGSIISSPARRPPQSPFKEPFQVSAQKLSTVGNSMLQSPFKPSLPAPKPTQETSAFKASLLQSPARRPQAPFKVSENSSPARSSDQKSLFAETPKDSTFKISRFVTPRALNRSVVRTGQMPPPSMPASTGSPGVSVDDAEDMMMGAEPSVPFSGRLSSIMARDADPSLNSPGPVTETKETEAALPGVGNGQVDEPLPGDRLGTIAVQDFMEHAAGPTISPPRNHTGFSSAFALRDRDASPFDDSDSEDELASDSANYSPVPIAAGNVSPDFVSFPATPSPFKAIAKTPKTAATVRSAYKNKIGFTPLAKQLSEWMTASPEKPDSEPMVAPEVVDEDATPKPSPAKSTFFEDAMSIRDEFPDEPDVKAEADILEENFDPVQLDDEDLALAHEADEMSMLEPDEIQALVSEELLEELNFDELQADETSTGTVTEFYPSGSEPEPAHDEAEATVAQQETEIQEAAASGAEGYELNMASRSHSDANDPKIAVEQFQEPEPKPEIESTPEPAPSEASQEYGDENAMPIDPQLLALAAQSPAPRAYSTPQPKRILGERVFHTISKVPLKAAAVESPMKRSASISRLPSQRPTRQLSRKNTVISYSPSKKTPSTQPRQQGEDVAMQDNFATPSKSAAWSNMGTPARTPRHDVNTALLKGAVVFVDVHTSEGADASALFTELLTQMGARCVKTWNWNRNAEDTSKIGITHVVFKDGGKRTLERAKETNGVVSCVGVGWVLDCERENKWLDESAYSVDTENIPRGGHRRRKSMEPRALAKMNGELLSSATPNRNTSPSKEFLHFPDTPVTSKSRRRESVQWFHSPVSTSGELDDESLILSPIPATPAPETISAYGEDDLYGEDTPVGQSPYYLQNASLVQKTAPVSRRYVDTEQEEDKTTATMGAGFLSEKKDEGVMARLLLARRKSLQFAPKVGSPLARGAGRC